MDAAIETITFGTVDGEEVQLYTLTNEHRLMVKVMTLGGIVTELHVPDRQGRLGDVLLGFDALAPYLRGHPQFGAVVGRVANRIKDAQFTLDGVTYQLRANDGRDQLHGGVKAFDRVVWAAAPSVTAMGPALKLTYVSPDGEEGYPGTLNAVVIYTLTHDDTFRVEMSATTDRVTIVNMAHHGYWNLGGQVGGTVLDHQLTVNAGHYTPGAPIIPDGRVQPVAGTPFDFRTPKTIGRDLKALGNHPIGYNDNYVVDGPAGALRFVARAKDPVSGRVMTLDADQPGVQLYTGNYMDGSTAGKGMVHAQHSGFCLETQKFPNAVNVPRWRDQVVLRPGQTYHHRMIHRFSTE